MAPQLIDPFPSIIDACEWCGCFKCVSYIGTTQICDNCLKTLEITHENLYDSLDHDQEPAASVAPMI